MGEIFVFDEESFAKKFAETALLEITPKDPLASDPIKDLESKDFEVKALSSPVSSFKASHLNWQPTARRKSSVYRRVSIKPSSVSSYTLELVIPSNLNTVDDYDSDLGHKRTLRDFEPIKVLGQGAYGKVHLVQDKVTKKLYAQKQLRKPVIPIHESSPDTHSTHVKRTIYERHILSGINHHPNIVKLFYALQDHDKFYLILEYIPGGELFHHLAYNNSLGNVFKEDHVAFYAAQMALALKHLHQLGIVYRDLKPENCLLDSRGHLILTDFGLSKELGDGDDQCTSIIGTPEYMAPEILKGERYDYAVDWWSLGCVIYDMMSGKPPFTGNSHKAIQDKILTKKLVLPFYFSMDAKDILNKLLNKTPTKRLQVDSQWDKFKQHRFFRKIDWKLLEAQDASVVPPIVPIITDPILAENFSPEFTNLKVSNYGLDQDIDTPDPSSSKDLFKGFSYTASSSFIDRYA